MDSYDCIQRTDRLFNLIQGVYVLAPSIDGPCKIGVAEDLPSRMEVLQMGCWKRLHPAFYGLFYNPGKVVKVATVAYRVERAVHRTLREFDLGLCGEWFDVSVDDAKAAVLKCADLIGAKYADPIKVMSYGGALLAASWEAAGVQKKMASLIMRNLEAVHDGVEALRAEEAA